MALRPIRPGAFIVVPSDHIDHFTDLPDDLAAHLMVVAQRLGRAALRVTRADRIGYVVHGYGVAHAHLNVVPQHDPMDIISNRFIVAEPGSYHITESAIDIPPRAELDAMAARIRGAVDG